LLYVVLYVLKSLRNVIKWCHLIFYHPSDRWLTASIPLSRQRCSWSIIRAFSGLMTSDTCGLFGQIISTKHIDRYQAIKKPNQQLSCFSTLYHTCYCTSVCLSVTCPFWHEEQKAHSNLSTMWSVSSYPLWLTMNSCNGWFVQTNKFIKSKCINHRSIWTAEFLLQINYSIIWTNH